MKEQIGRPTVMNETTVLKLEQALRDGFSVEMACYTSGVGRSTYYEHLQQDCDFADKMELAKEYTTQRAKQVVAQAINAGQVKVAQWWLERKARDEFSDKPMQVVEQKHDLFAKVDTAKLYDLMEDTVKALALAEAS